MKKYLKSMLLMAVSSFSIHTAFAADATSPVKNLEPWSGSWVAAVDVMQRADVDSALKNAYVELGKKDGVSADEWKANKIAKWNAGEIKKIEITNTDVTFETADGKKITNSYESKGMVKFPYQGKKELDWYAFESKSDNAYKYLAFRPSGKTQQLSHFHFRNSGKSFEEMKSQDVFKTMVAPKTTAEQLKSDFME